VGCPISNALKKRAEAQFSAFDSFALGMEGRGKFGDMLKRVETSCQALSSLATTGFQKFTFLENRNDFDVTASRLVLYVLELVWV
jgi:hypothetical protein